MGRRKFSLFVVAFFLAFWFAIFLSFSWGVSILGVLAVLLYSYSCLIRETLLRLQWAVALSSCRLLALAVALSLSLPVPLPLLWPWPWPSGRWLSGCRAVGLLLVGL